MKNLIFLISLLFFVLLQSGCGNATQTETFERMNGSICITVNTTGDNTDSLRCYVLREVYAKGIKVRNDTSFFTVPLLGKDKYGYERRYNVWYNRVGL